MSVINIPDAMDSGKTLREEVDQFFEIAASEVMLAHFDVVDVRLYVLRRCRSYHPCLVGLN